MVHSFYSDYGFRPANESESLWDPYPNQIRDQEMNLQCVRDESVNITIGKPAFCPYGTTYNHTIGMIAPPHKIVIKRSHYKRV